MAPPTRLDIAKPDIEALFAKRPGHAYTRKELSSLLEANRKFWRLAQRTNVDEFAGYLTRKAQLTQVVLKARSYPRQVTRFVWGTASSYVLATSIKPGSAYLSHATAVFIHGLTDLIPRVLYVNVEQSPKPRPASLPSQETIDRAFRNQQRSSNLIYEIEGGPDVVVLSGKSTGNLEVVEVPDPNGAPVRVTSLERTLIDIVVRPTYAGGVTNVLDAYRAAMARLSTNRLRAVLRKLDYAYPYHQAVGFLLQRAGYPAERVKLFRAMPIQFDFYLAHGIKDPDYDSEWRLFFPRGI